MPQTLKTPKIVMRTEKLQTAETVELTTLLAATHLMYVEQKSSNAPPPRWVFCAPVPVDLFCLCLIPFRVAIGVRSNEDPSRDPEKFLEED